MLLAGCLAEPVTEGEDAPKSGYVFDDPAPSGEEGPPEKATPLEEQAPSGEEEPLELAEEPLEQKPAPEPAAPAPEPEPKPAPTAAQLSCEKGGGTFAKTTAGVFVCAQLTGEGQKTCAGPQDCQGECLARSRTCAPMTPLVGCHDLITRSGGVANVCLN